MDSERKAKKSKRQAMLTAGTDEHEKAVKGVLAANLDSTLDLLERLDVMEAKELQIGNAFLAFRFSETATPPDLSEEIQSDKRE